MPVPAQVIHPIKPSGNMHIKYFWDSKKPNNYSKTLCSVNVETLEKVETLLNLPQGISLHSIICELPDDSLFVGWDRAYIISENNIQTLNPGVNLYSAGGIYYNNAIYVFGGEPSVSLKYGL